MVCLSGYRSIGRPTEDEDENLRRAERKAFNVLRIALIDLADSPLSDELGVARARQKYRFAKDNWASALRTLDAMAGNQ
ncbi:MAG: hypothetical protein FD144_2640 [Rhodospirillaceae bacterium]|nr:MAG: hypothetical protein FD144_2640 [Rhodospirillaceae bacterium]